MAYETILYEVDDRVALITLNRPEHHNALSKTLCAECSLLDATNTAEYAKFDELRRTKGLGEALEWRDAQFAPFE